MKRIISVLLITAVLLATPWFSIGAAAESAAPADAFVVSADSGVNASDGSPSTAYDGTNFFTVWVNGTDIYGARVTPDGEVLDPSGIAISVGLNGSTADPRPPSVAFDGVNYLVVWVSTRGAANEVYGCRVTPNGEVLDPSGIKITTGGSPKIKPVGIVFNGSEYFIVWRTLSDVIRGLRVETDGTAVGNPAGFQVMSWGFYPTVAYDPADNIYLVASYRNSTSGLLIHCARVSGDGTVLDAQPTILCDEDGNRAFPRVAFDGDNFMVIWTDSRSDATGMNGSLYGARVSPAGAMLGQPFLIAYRVIQNAFANLVFNGTDYLAVWSSTIGDYWTAEKFRLPDAYAARISTDGTVLDRQTIPLCTAFAHQVGTSVAYGDGRYLTTWNDMRPNDSGTYTIYGRILDHGMDTRQTPYTAQMPPAEVTWTGQTVGLDRGAGSGVATDSENARLFGPDNNLVYRDETWQAGESAGGEYACYAVGASDIWAGGWAGFIKHFSDGVWTDLHPNSGSSLVTGLWGDTSDDMWASLSCPGAFTHFDGSAWHTVASASPGDVQDIMGAGPDDIWAVGECGAVQHWDGASWSSVSDIPTLQTLNALWVNGPDDAFAVGDSGVILHWDGASWTAQTSPTMAHLKDVWGVDGSNVYAVGTCGTVLHYDGASWSPENAGTVNDLLTVFGGYGTDGTCRLWAAGYGTTVFSKTITVPAPVMALPEDFRVTAADSDSADFAWTLSDDRKVTGYVVEYRTEGEADWTSISLNRTDACTVSGLDNTKSYSFRLRAQYNYVYLSPATAELGGSILKLTVRFDTWDGRPWIEVSVNKGDAVTRPEDPSREGYLFGGWYTDTSWELDKEWDFDTVVTDGITLYARWIEACTVRFDTMDGRPWTEISIPKGNAVDRPEDPSREGYLFGGWYTGLDYETVWNFDIVFTQDTTLYAKWTATASAVPTVATGTVSGVTASCATLNGTVTADGGAAVTGRGFVYGTSDNPIFGDSDVTRVTSGDGAGSFSKTITGLSAGTTYHVRAYAINSKGTSYGSDIAFTTLFTVAFNSQDGSAVAGQTASYDTTISAPTAPTRTGYTFGGWYRETACNNAWSFTADRVIANITLYAKWTANTYTVAYNGNGATGGVTASNRQTYGTSAKLTANGFTKTGYTFAGWATSASGSVVYTNSQNVQNLSSVNGATVTLYAKWTINTYTVTFNSQNGSAVASKKANYNTAITAPTAPTRTGYTFGGWYKEAACKNAWSFTTDKVIANITLYAKWTANKYTITAAPNNTGYGSVTGTGSYAYGTSVTLKAVPKAGYRFSRWLEGTTQVSTGAEYKFSVSKARTLKAEFAKIGVPTVKAASGSYNSTKLTWAAVAGAKEYEVYRAASSSGTYTKIATITTASYTNTGLTMGKTYYYKVRVKCVAGSTTTYGGYSAIVSAKPVPAAPTAKAARASSTSIKVTWGAVSGATKYEVYRAASKNGTYTKLGESASLNYTNTKLTTGKTYYYKVRAYRLVGSTKVYGPFSSIVYAKP